MHFMNQPGNSWGLDPFASSFSILPADVLLIGIGIGLDTVLGASVQWDGSDPAVGIGAVIVDSRREIHAGGIEGQILLSILRVNTPFDHGAVVQNMEKLCQSVGRVFLPGEVGSGVGGTDEAGDRGEVPGHTQCADADAKALKGLFAPMDRPGVFGVEVKVLVEVGEVPIEGGIVGHDAHGVMVDGQTLPGSFCDDGFPCFVSYHPMEGGQGGIPVYGDGDQLTLGKEVCRLVRGVAQGEDLQNEVVGGEVSFSCRGSVGVTGVPGEVQTGTGQAAFIHGVRQSRVSVDESTHSQDGAFRTMFFGGDPVKTRGILWYEQGGLPEGAGEVHISSEKKTGFLTGQT